MYGILYVPILSMVHIFWLCSIGTKNEIGYEYRKLCLCVLNWMAGQLLNNHVAIETDWNVRRLDCEGFHQLQCIVTDEDLRGRNVLHFNWFLLLRDCSTIPQPYLCCSNEPLPNYWLFNWICVLLGTRAMFVHVYIFSVYCTTTLACASCVCNKVVCSRYLLINIVITVFYF